MSLFNTGMKIEGLQGLEKSLKSIDKEIAQKLVKSSVREAQKETLSAAKSNAISMVGGKMGALIASKLKLKVNKKVKDGIAVDVIVGSDAEFASTSKRGKRAWIPNAINFGHKKRGGGRVAEIDFLGDAAKSTVSGKVNRLVNKLKKGLDKHWKKQAKGGK